MLLPLPREDVDAYRQRLETPLCRTAAWRLVLQTEDGPVAVRLPESPEHARVLVDLLRSLIAP